jgi:5-methylcytosine-specific restriction endonuclease McrA
MRKFVKCAICGEKIKYNTKERIKHIRDKHQDEYKQALVDLAKYAVGRSDKREFTISETITCGVCGVVIYDYFNALVDHIHEYHKEGESLLFHYAIVKAINGGEGREEKQSMKVYFNEAQD